jgi:histidinol-phosphatase (PHP family)
LDEKLWQAGYQEVDILPVYLVKYMEMIAMDFYDCHTHSTFSFDGKAALEEQCQAAMNKGLAGICLTEHFSVDSRDVSFGVLDYENYHNTIDCLRRKFEGRLYIGRGLEIGEPHLPQCSAALVKALAGMQLDFIIGSIHNIDGVKLRNYMQGKSKEQLYTAYFKEILAMVETADIDVIGHLDLVKLYGAIGGYGDYAFAEYRELLSAIMKCAIQRGIGLELNTAGWRKEAGQQYPAHKVLRLYKELGGRIITLGSNAHKGQDVGADFERAKELLLACGFNSCCYFVNRQPFYVSLRKAGVKRETAC